jgi:hypothetical protein
MMCRLRFQEFLLLVNENVHMNAMQKYESYGLGPNGIELACIVLEHSL